MPMSTMDFNDMIECASEISQMIDSARTIFPRANLG
jgi:hypothetical protein